MSITLTVELVLVSDLKTVKVWPCLVFEGNATAMTVSVEGVRKVVVKFRRL